MEQEKRMRREIANSNERRRMQSINAGFQSLRGLLPQHEGEKLSKAAILQQTSEYIYQLEQDKTKIMNQNTHLKRLLATATANNSGGEGSGTSSGGAAYASPHSPTVDIPPSIVKRRKTVDGAVESADEGIGSMSPDHSGSGEESRSEVNELRRETMELRLQLERERRHRMGLEEHIGLLQQQNQQHQSMYRKYDPERMQAVEEVETYPHNNVRMIHDENPRCYTIRNNLETIVEAIRHLEGDHLFSDDRNNSSPSSSPASGSPARDMEICSSPEGSPVHQPQSILEMTITAPMTTTPTVTSLKHHVLSRIARTSEVEEQPINLEYRPISRSPSPGHIQENEQFQQVQFNMQQQLRPGVIVVKRENH